MTIATLPSLAKVEHAIPASNTSAAIPFGECLLEIRRRLESQ